MLFSFLTYLQPTHYFSLRRQDGSFLYPKVEVLPDSMQAQLTADDDFKSPMARAYDLSWQALHKGYIGDAATYSTFESVPVEDNYRFIRKYFNSAWVYYVLAIRLLTFHNPIKEFVGCYHTRHTKRSRYLQSPSLHDNIQDFESELVSSSPKVSVIIPTLNRYAYLKDVLKDLESQEYPNFEVIVMDQSEPFQKDFYEGFHLNLQVHYQEERALWLARNTAIRLSEGEFVLLFDDDSRVATDWIANHLKCLDYFKADLSSGVSISKVGAKIPEHYSFFRISDQLDTGNVLLKKAIFKSLGLFDRQFEKQRMGDGEFGLRAYLAGFKNVSNPLAKRLHLKVDSGGLREMASWDAFRTTKLFTPRPIPSVLYFFRRYFGTTQARWALLRTVPMSIMPYRFKKNKALTLVGVFVSVLLLPLVLLQVLKSWRLSSRKLEQGPLIERLN